MLPLIGAGLAAYSAYKNKDKISDWLNDDGRKEVPVPEFGEVDTKLQGGDAMRQDSKGYRREIDTRNPFSINQGPQAGTRNSQLGAANKLMGMVGQRGPSIADQQAAQARDASLGQQASLARSGRGNPALAARNAARMVAQQGQQISGQQMTGRMQEEQMMQQRDLAAAQAAGGLYSGARGQDIGLASDVARFSFDQRSQEDQARLAQQAFEMGISQAELEARLRQQATRSGFDSSIYGSQMGQAPTQTNSQKLLDAGLGVGGAALMSLASDERAKENVSSADSAIDRLLSSMKPKEYDYKDPSDGEGRKAGVMAQDLEKSDIGKRMVEEDETGKKHIKGKDFMSVTLASLARINERLSKIEGE